MLAGGPTPPPRWRARRRPNTWRPAPLGPAFPPPLDPGSLLPSGPGSPSSPLPASGEPLKGLLASGADTGLFCSFSPSPAPPYLGPCSPGRPRTSRSLLLSPTPSSGQARAGEALPTAPPVTSAPGRIPTLGLSREGWAERACAPAAALGVASSEQGEKGPRGGGRGGGRRPKARPLGQMLTQLRAPGPRGAGKWEPPPLPRALGLLQRRGVWAGTEVGVGGGHGEPAGAARTGWGTAPPRPGWGGWGAVCGKELSANGNQAWESGRALALLSSGEQPAARSLAQRCPSPARGGVRSQRAGRGPGRSAGQGCPAAAATAPPSPFLCSDTLMAGTSSRAHFRAVSTCPWA